MGFNKIKAIFWVAVILEAISSDATMVEPNFPAFHPMPELKIRSPTVQRSNQLQLEANECFKNNKYKEAIDLFGQAILANPENPISYCNRALVHIKMENYGQAVDDAGKAILLNKDYAKAYYRRATAEMALGKFKTALADLKAVASSAPPSAAPWVTQPPSQASPPGRGGHKQALSQLTDAACEKGGVDTPRRMKQCENIVRRQMFEEAISGQHGASPFAHIAVDEIDVLPSYTGPRWDEGEITAAFVEDMVSWMEKQKVLNRKYAYKILIKANDLLTKLPNIVEVPIPQGTELTVCGDTHGQFFDLLNIFKINGRPSPQNPYVFNGDFVDRGSWSVEVILTLLAYKVLYSDSVHLTRGNHETMNMNKLYGFEGEVMFKYNRHMYDCFTELFCNLPLALTLNGKVLVCHGGLFRDDRVSLDDVRREKRNCEPPEEGILCDILWSDPQDCPGRNVSKRGTGCMFGPDVTEKWLKENGLELLVRSHEMKDDGYEVAHNGRCITVFSAPNYCDMMANKGAFLRFNSACGYKATTFAAVPHPALRPMFYSPMGLRGLSIGPPAAGLGAGPAMSAGMSPPLMAGDQAAEAGAFEMGGGLTEGAGGGGAECMMYDREE